VVAVIFAAVAACLRLHSVRFSQRSHCNVHPDRLGFGNVYGQGSRSAGSFQPRVGSAGQAVDMRQQARRLSVSLVSPSLHLSETSPHRGSSSEGMLPLFGSRSPQGTSPPSTLCLKLCLRVVV
jgi:hypothetical protein